MKRIISLLIAALVILTSTCIITGANSADNEVIRLEHDGYEYTVEFADANISAEKKEALAMQLIGADEAEVMPANVICDWFGHMYQTTTSYVTRHKVRTAEPRCDKLTYNLKYCENCEINEQTLIRTDRISCCPVD